MGAEKASTETLWYWLHIPKILRGKVGFATVGGLAYRWCTYPNVLGFGGVSSYRNAYMHGP